VTSFSCFKYMCVDRLVFRAQVLNFGQGTLFDDPVYICDPALFLCLISRRFSGSLLLSPTCPCANESFIVFIYRSIHHHPCCCRQ
jgi:hypothetical protein